MATDNVDELKILVAQSCRVLGKENMTREPAGHVSARIPGTDRFIIKGRGPGEAALRYTRPEDLMILDFAGRKVEGRPDLNAPNETSIHAEVFKARPDVNCVIHVHPTNVVLFTITDTELMPIVGAYDPQALAMVLAGIPRYDRSILINSPELGQDLVKALGDKSVCLMQGHGITACGPSVQEATITAWRLNDLADINYKARLLGTPRPISDEDIAVFTRQGGGAPRAPREGMAPPTGVPGGSTWTYLEKWIEED